MSEENKTVELKDEELEKVAGGISTTDEYTLEWGSFYCKSNEDLYQNPVYLVRITYFDGNNVGYRKGCYWSGNREITWNSGESITNKYVFQDDFPKKLTIPSDVKY